MTRFVSPKKKSPPFVKPRAKKSSPPVVVKSRAKKSSKKSSPPKISIVRKLRKKITSPPVVKQPDFDIRYRKWLSSKADSIKLI